MSATTNQASASKTVKRRNWTLEEDIVLLKQVVAEAPFAAGPRRLTDAWTTLAETIKTCDGFTRETFNRTSARISGVNEDEAEKIQLLDNVLELVDEAKAVDQSKSAQAKEDQMKIEEDGHCIRDMALQSLGKRQKKDETSDSKSENKRSSLATAIDTDSKREADWREKELSFKKAKLEASIIQQQLDREERVADRAAERDHQLKLAQIESDKIMTLIKALADSKRG
ncbi:hypothetical protein AC1031_020246 [Aphanomyces cochlioides]|nr:hypothetical protein AC1031_020246 [Aphanomyces cochlioides]